MITGKVAGTVVCAANSDRVFGGKYLLIEKCNQKGETSGDFLVALDNLGAGNDEIVMISQGSSARQTKVSDKKGIDAIVIGIIDIIEEESEIVYKK